MSATGVFIYNSVNKNTLTVIYLTQLADFTKLILLSRISTAQQNDSGRLLGSDWTVQGSASIIYLKPTGNSTSISQVPLGAKFPFQKLKEVRSFMSTYSLGMFSENRKIKHQRKKKNCISKLCKSKESAKEGECF